jgi:diaminohydroxyphosphoribosylaminopyrimidine deaminase / 5-amino-6-(5-phosphoribosylamino)uracil reductase
MKHVHERFMLTALQLAQRGLGQTWPNPTVGAVLVKDGQIIATGVTANGGRPHGETIAITRAGSHAKGATLYVTLEPCSHHGKTPPCVNAIIATGIREVVIACTDSNPLVAGQGIVQLKNAGIAVITGICEKEARELNRGFFSVMEKKRPFIALKIATSLDGKMATRSGESKWITGKRAREYGHLIRSQMDAIVTGIGTVLADDPLLTCRLPGLEDRSPQAVVLDRKNRLSSGSNLAKKGAWVYNNPDIQSVIESLTQKGVTRLLIEAGPQLSTAFLQSGLVDRIFWFRAPIIIGNDGLAACNNEFDSSLQTLAQWRRVQQVELQPDTLEIFECSPA